MKSTTSLAHRVMVHTTIALVLACALLVGIPLVGGTISLREALRHGPWESDLQADALIFWQTRLPRVLLALLAGGALAMAGLVFQNVLRNPLAEPYILGVSGGAALGKMIVVLGALSGGSSFYVAPTVVCFVGALLPIFFLQLLGRSMRHFSAVTLLLAGVMLNVFFSALILLAQYFADFTQVQAMFLWMMGGLDVVGYRWLIPMAFIFGGGVALLLMLSRTMNVLALGTESARHLGVSEQRVVTALVWVAALLTAVTVAIAGPIGFVGLIVPHILRTVFGSDHRLLVPLCALYGGTFLALCDFLGWRSLELATWFGLREQSAAEIPVGIVTAVVGAPFFLWLLISHRKTTNS